MAIPLEDLIEGRVTLKQFRLGRQECPYCHDVLQETITGKRVTPEGEACSDCYYQQLGQEVETHPIVTARVRRG